MTRDFVLGCVLLAISAAYYLGAAAIPGSDLADAVGPSGLPDVYAILLAVLSLALMTRSMRARRPVHAVTSPDDREPRSIRRVAALLAFGIVYIAVVPSAGYPVSIAALLVATALYQGHFAPAAAMASASRRPVRQVLLVGIAGAGLLWMVFVLLLGIPQPSGIWPTLWSGS